MKTITKIARNKRADKKQINIKWNSRLFFQIGVIASLLIVFFVMQTDFQMKTAAYEPPTSSGISEPPIIHYVIDVDKPKPVDVLKNVTEKRSPIQKVVKSSTFLVKPNTDPNVETPIAATNAPVIELPKPTIDNAGDKPAKPRSMISVEFVPVYPGCESLGTKDEKMECMSSKISSFINKNFRKELLENLKANKKYRIYVNFKIDSNGFVTDVVANSNDENLKKEAQRVIGKLPTMQPGKQGDKNVDVLYTVPIIFMIQ